MVTRIIDLEQETVTLDDLLQQLNTETELLLMRGDEPIARIVAEAQSLKAPRIPGLHRNSTWVSDDFDDPLPDEFWLGES